jgi:hypothetical protein
MAVTWEVDRSVGDPESLTHGVTALTLGPEDALDPREGLEAGTDSMHAVLRVHLLALDGSVGLAGLRVFSDPLAPGWTLATNATTDPKAYQASQRTTYHTYQPPSTARSRVPYRLPTGDPFTPNLGIQGDLDGILATVDDVSDYLYLQARAEAGVREGCTLRLYIAYDEVG